MTHGRPVIFGEVLFDCFAEEATLGGAPFNVAWHLRGFGLNPLFISRIGADALGSRVVETMQRWGMDLSGLQRDPRRPTGTVRVALEKGKPRFEILPEQAYNYIDAAALPILEPRDCALLYYGTLALRSEVPRAALRSAQQAQLPTFIDVNLRAPWWRRERSAELARGADCVKLNEAELAGLAGRGHDLPALASQLKAALNIAALVVTLSEQGAFVLADGKIHDVKASPVAPIVDTVGAGDAFSAVIILGMLASWSWPQRLQRAADGLRLTSVNSRSALSATTKPCCRFHGRFPNLTRCRPKTNETRSFEISSHEQGSPSCTLKLKTGPSC